MEVVSSDNHQLYFDPECIFNIRFEFHYFKCTIGSKLFFLHSSITAWFNICFGVTAYYVHNAFFFSSHSQIWITEKAYTISGWMQKKCDENWTFTYFGLWDCVIWVQWRKRKKKRFKYTFLSHRKCRISMWTHYSHL